MNSKIYSDVIKLESALKESLEYKNLLLANEKLEKNDEVKVLSYYKDMAILEYEDALKHYGRNALETLKKNKELAKRIYDLNNHPLVKNYNEAYKKMNLNIEIINNELFGFFKEIKND